VPAGPDLAGSVLVLPPEPQSVGQARRWLAGVLENWPIEPSRVNDAALVLSEFVTNAILHGAGDVVCHLSHLAGALCIGTTDLGTELPHVVESPERTGGFGLHIVDRIAQDWGVAPFPGGKLVWALIPAQ
jgi:anti-sigma regulatory factor (Ser/Thr protein kinase)